VMRWDSSTNLHKILIHPLKISSGCWKADKTDLGSLGFHLQSDTFDPTVHAWVHRSGGYGRHGARQGKAWRRWTAWAAAHQPGVRWHNLIAGLGAGL
jgi:hypothetical protein